MGLGSIILGVFALLCTFAGIVTTVFPFVGTMLSFLAPLLALAGIVVGGVGLSRAREDGDNDGLSLAGVVVSAVAFFPAMFVALTCGICNTLCTGAMLTPDSHSGQSTPFWLQDGGGASPFDSLFPDAGTGSATGAAPPPAFPPPPIVPPPIVPAPTPPVPAPDPDPSDPDPSAAPTPGAHVPGQGSPPGTGPPALPPPPLPPGPTP